MPFLTTSGACARGGRWRQDVGANRLQVREQWNLQHNHCAATCIKSYAWQGRTFSPFHFHCSFCNLIILAFNIHRLVTLVNSPRAISKWTTITIWLLIWLKDLPFRTILRNINRLLLFRKHADRVLLISLTLIHIIKGSIFFILKLLVFTIICDGVT